jgi:hypothetical protein
MTIAAFAFHGSGRTAVGVAALALLLVGSIPAALTIVAPTIRTLTMMHSQRLLASRLIQVEACIRCAMSSPDGS